MIIVKIIRVRVTSEYEYVLEVEDDANWEEIEDLAWEHDWTPLIHNGDVDEIYEGG